MIILKEESRREINESHSLKIREESDKMKAVAKKVGDMEKTRDYDGLSKDDFLLLQDIVNMSLAGGWPCFYLKTGAKVADWLKKQGIRVTQGKIAYSVRESVKRSFNEASNLPAIAQVAGVAVNSRITQVVRQDTIYSTVQAMGLSVKINAMKNVVAEVPDMPTAGAVLQKIYQAFGVKGSFMVTWEGKGKLYWDPRTPVDKAPALAYAKQAGLPPPNFAKLLV